MTGAFPWREDSPVVEPDVTAYGGFKVAAERALLARHVTSGFPATIARPAAIYGPYNNIYDMEAAMFRRLFERRPVLLPYHGLVVGSYGHVDDLCRALLVMAAHPSAVGEVFNVTTSAVTSAAYVATLAEVVGVEPDVVLLPDDLAQTASRPLFSRLFTPAHHGMLDASKITRVLGFLPAYDLRAGHAQTLEWFRRSGAAVVDKAQIGPAMGPHVRLRLRGQGRRAGQSPMTRRPRHKETRWTPIAATDRPPGDRRPLRALHVRTRHQGLGAARELLHRRAGVRPPGRTPGGVGRDPRPREGSAGVAGRLPAPARQRRRRGRR